MTLLSVEELYGGYGEGDILKGIDPAYGRYLHIRPANEGIVTGRRTGASRAIGRAARKAAGWKRKKGSA